MVLLNKQSTLLAGLNPEQLTAVTLPPQSALILAGAGSGKTRVLITRIAWLLTNKYSNINNILAVTFTNKAANEMKQRLKHLLSITSIEPMWIGTFHGLCHRLLKQHYHDAHLPASFQILDHSDQLSLIKRLLKQHQISEEILDPKTLQNFINTQKECGLRAQYLHNNNQNLIQMYQEYEIVCQHEGVVDFAELLLRSYELLQQNPNLLTYYQQRFKHILIDEFQDTNKLQYAWLKLLAGEHAAIFAVGDDDQSIYRFRGADIGNMNHLIDDFNIAHPIKLEQNYRSTAPILQAANAIISYNTNRLGKNLRTNNTHGEKISLYCASTDNDEAEYVSKTIQILRKKNLTFNQIAILYRSNAQSRLLEQALLRAHIPYTIYGGRKFYERQEIKNALAYLRLSIYPDDDNALLRIINFPIRGIGERTQQQIQNYAHIHHCSLWQASCSLSSQSSKINAFTNLIHHFIQIAQTATLPQLLEKIIEHSGLSQFYKKNNPLDDERINNLHELIQSTNDFYIDHHYLNTPASDNQLNPALNFLNNIALESENTSIDHIETVKLMTIHAAKGLEFDAIFIIGLEEGRFPNELSLNEHDGLAEERRLMYVAITRARQYLYLSMAKQRSLYGRIQQGILSRFVDEIPTEIVHVVSHSTVPHRDLNNTDHLRFNKSSSNTKHNYHGWYIGDKIYHEKFGNGTIIAALDKNTSALLTVEFQHYGIKKLDSSIAKLQRIS